MAAIDLAIPQEFRVIAESLGIDFRKPTELAHYGRDESGLHLTGGWFHFVGKILSGADGFKALSETTSEPDFENLTSTFDFGLTNRLALVSSQFKVHPDLVQLEFHSRIPWVIPEPEYD